MYPCTELQHTSLLGEALSISKIWSKIIDVILTSLKQNRLLTSRCYYCDISSSLVNEWIFILLFGFKLFQILKVSLLRWKAVHFLFNLLLSTYSLPFVFVSHNFIRRSYKHICISPKRIYITMIHIWSGSDDSLVSCIPYLISMKNTACSSMHSYAKQTADGQTLLLL